jgi:hypothetical protein
LETSIGLEERYVRSRWRKASLVIGVIVLLNQLNWMMVDVGPQPHGDEYAGNILTFARDHLSQGWFSIGALQEIAVGPRPILYQALAMPLLIFRGPECFLSLLPNLLFLGVLFAATYQIGVIVRGEMVGMVAAVLVTSYPPIIVLTRIFRPHAALPACEALSIWSLCVFSISPSIRSVWIMCACFGISFFMHPLMIVGLLPASIPFLICGMRTARTKDKGWRLIVSHGFAAAMTCVVLPHSLWYLPRLEDVALLISRERRSVMINGGEWIGRSYFWSILSMPEALTLPAVLALGVAVIYVLSVGRKMDRVIFAALMLEGFALALRKGTQGWMNFAILLPLVAVLTASATPSLYNLCRHSRGALKVAALLGLSMIPLATVTCQLVVGRGWGAGIKEYLPYLGLNSANCNWRMNVMFCPDPPREVNTAQTFAKDIKEIGLDPECQGGNCLVYVVGPDWRASIWLSTQLRLAASNDLGAARISIAPGRLTSPRKVSDLLYLVSDFVYSVQLNKNAGRSDCSSVYRRAVAKVNSLFIEVAHRALPAVEIPGQTRYFDKHALCAFGVLYRRRSSIDLLKTVSYLTQIGGTELENKVLAKSLYFGRFEIAQYVVKPYLERGRSLVTQPGETSRIPLWIPW